MIGKLIGGLVGIVGALWLGIAGVALEWKYEHDFAGWSWRPHLWIIPLPAIVIPPGLAIADAGRLRAVQSQLAIAVGNERTLTLALNAQSAAVRDEAARGVTALAQAETAVSAQRSAAAKAVASESLLAAALQSIPAGTDECAKAQAVDAAFLEILK